MVSGYCIGQCSSRSIFFKFCDLLLLPSLHEVLLQYVTQILERNCCLCELCMRLLNFPITWNRGPSGTSKEDWISGCGGGSYAKLGNGLNWGLEGVSECLDEVIKQNIKMWCYCRERKSGREGRGMQMNTSILNMGWQPEQPLCSSSRSPHPNLGNLWLLIYKPNGN